MAVTQEMVLVRIEDIAAYAEARTLVRAAEGQAGAAAGLRVAAQSLCVSVAEALRALSPREEIRRLRDAAGALGDLRARVWASFSEGELEPPAFDDLMAGSARCRAEIDRWESHVRHRARRQIDFAE